MITDRRDALIHPQRRLPDVTLATTGGATRPIRSAGRRAPVLVLVHGIDCAACAEFVARLSAAADDLRAWDGDVAIIIPQSGDRDEGSNVASAFPVLMDAEQRVAGALGITPPAVVIADQWGEVHEIHEAGEAHGFPDFAEIEGWLRYLAIQCPECQGEAL